VTVDANTQKLLERAAKELAEARYAVALTGAGISTESGIPDFRGPEGVWTRNPDAERQAYELYPKFMRDPKAYWRETLTRPIRFFTDMEKAQPNPGHFALVELEQMGILKSTITQNIDALHDKAGSKKLLEYHGSLLKMRCPDCHTRFDRKKFDLEDMLKNDLLPPRCPDCSSAIKSDIVYFGEPIPPDVAEQSYAEAQKCDVMLICGTSAVVYPFASLPIAAAGESFGRGLFPTRKTGGATIIEINGEPTPLTHQRISTYLIQGKTGELLPLLLETVRKVRANSGR
jgi:NAD-dependent deacetylase